MTSPPSTAAPLIFASADQFKFLADMIPQLVWITDPSGYHLHFNQRWTDFTGYTLADSVGPDMWNNLLHPDDQQRARQVWGHSLATGADYDIEYRFRAKDGSYRWFLGSARPQRDAEGRITTWFGTCTDIDDQKQIEAELRRHEEEFTTLANNISHLAWMAEPNGDIFWYNKRWYDYTGTNLAQMQGWGWEEVHHPDHLQRVVAQWSEHLAAGQAWEDTFPLRSAQGEYGWFLSRAKPIRDEVGNIVRWFGTNTDITKQVELQEQLERSYADLEAKITFRTLDLEHQVQSLKQRLGA